MRDLKPTISFFVMPLLALGLFAAVAKAQNEAPNISRRPDSVRLASLQKTPATEARTPESADKKLVATQETTPDSALLALRDGISAAPNDQERTQLQLKLVEHLVNKGLKHEAIV
ncbi:MAG: hypothetical protein ACREBG_10710, partial [Pyrinomonadaceae bacterium]